MSAEQKKTRGAVFYDVDGTLVDTNIVFVYVQYALRLQGIGKRFKKFLRSSLYAPFYVTAELLSRSLFNRVFYSNYRGIREEGLRILGREIVRDAVLPRLYEDARARIEKAASMDLPQVIVSGSLDYVLEPLAEALGIEYVIANRLEIRDGKATGKLLGPVIAGEGKRVAMREFAREQGIDLSRSYAFADSRADLQMLEAVGFPCAVNPDPFLRSRSEERGWPILRFQ